MKPSEGVERITPIWNRWIRCWKKSDRFCEDHDVPIRLRGYSEIVMGNLPPKERKSIDTALRRGYSLAKANRATSILDLVTKSVSFCTGYLGKTQGSLWFPDSDARDACMQHIEAQLVMTEKFNANGINERGSHIINIQVKQEWGDNPLKSHMTELRTVVDEHMALWAQPREALANSLLPDDAVIRVPFDSHKGRNK
jgi:hypothetical protein